MENNIPFVGEEEAAYGRQMNWMRVERLWDGEYPEVKTEYQPVMCQQCGSAPCEPVCPVFASVHSEAERLNVQVYNRCVGTRYCANNCPYVARTFNWADYALKPEHAYTNEAGELVFPLHNQFNPDVTVRRRGVMEKCTFCVQRIHQAQDTAKAEGRDVFDGEVQPACAQACPADAIVFGRIDDPETKVSKLAREGRNFKLLEDLGTLPNVTYLKGGPYGRNG
jgi:molybdopterin-containing oxidoreductase family iron-sulfur binding subunit